MEIEKMKSSGAVPYQGSTAVPAEAGSSAPAIRRPEEPAVAKLPVKEDFSIEKTRDGEEPGVAGEANQQQETQLKKAVSDLNKQMKDSEAIFGVHEKTNRLTIKIVDKSTKEVLKEYPPEQTLDMIAKVWEIAGILVDEKG